MNAMINHLGQTIGFPVPDWKPATRPTLDVMTGRSCRLEALDSARHAADLFAALSQDVEGKNWSYLPYGPFGSLASYIDWIDSVCSDTDPLFFALVNKATGKAVGVASFLRIVPEQGSIEVGHLNFAPVMQRTVIATEAMWLMMQRAFSLGFRRYEWKCNALNQASRRAAQRLGFSFEGIFRQASVVKGHNRDTAWYAVIDREWPALNDAFQAWLAADNFDAGGRQRVSLRSLTEALRAAKG